MPDDSFVRRGESPKTCCLNCQAYEERTGFCRLNPPQVDSNGSRFPKIQMPFLDYCLQFKMQKS